MPAEPLDALLGQETGEELDDELLDPGRGHVSIQGIGSGATVSHGVLGIPAMDCHLDRETPAPSGRKDVGAKAARARHRSLRRPDW